MKHLCIGIGEVVWDVFRNSSTPDKNEIKKLGGAPANFTYFCQALGEEGILVSSIGADPEGYELLSCLKKLPLDCRYINVSQEYPTGSITISLTESSEPCFSIKEQVAWDNLTDSASLHELASQADVVCFGTLAQRSKVSRETIVAFLQNTKTSALRIFDCNLRKPFYSRDILDAAFKFTNILKVNENELRIIGELFCLPAIDDATKLAKIILSQHGLDIVAVTRGSKGSILVTNDSAFSHPGFRIQLVDSVGAGDAFTAGLAVGLLNNMPLAQTQIFANRIAAYACTCMGATPEIPNFLKNRNNLPVE